MRLLFLAAYIANLSLSYALLTHPQGRFLARPGITPVLLLGVLYTLLAAAILWAPRLLRRCPGRWIDIPNRGYWLQPANLAEAARKIQARLLTFGVVTFLFLLLVGLLVLRFQQAPQPQPELWALRSVTLFFLVYAVYWLLALRRDFRVSHGGHP